MSMIGYYDGTAVRINEPLQVNQKVIVIRGLEIFDKIPKLEGSM